MKRPNGGLKPACTKAERAHQREVLRLHLTVAGVIEQVFRFSLFVLERP